MDSVIETFYGHIKTIQDAEICLEACIHGRLPLITHMPVVLTGLCIRSGSVIVFPENANNIQLNRWRDGGRWSASRICGNFLLYREIEPTIKGAQQRQSTLLPKTPYSRRGTLEKSSLFTTLSLRKDTTLVPNGLAKRTITLVGSGEGGLPRIVFLHQK
ncbi:gluconate transport inducer 1/Pac2 [Chytriomyces cf. hyalinus JEL632]|nr:gluconate transport inducer 1/Pac2 [Chytriomyces cf. hyalinus JEL632]